MTPAMTFSLVVGGGAITALMVAIVRDSINERKRKLSKRYTSHVKLDRLGGDAAVRFEGSLEWWYKKSDGKWSRYNWMEKDIMAFPSKTLVNYHNGRPFEVIREGKK